MNRIKLLRNEANLSLRELATLVGMTHSTLALIEKGKQPLREHHIERLCAFFNCSTDFLIGKSDMGIGVFFNDDFKIISYKKYVELYNDIGCDVSVIETDIPTTTFRVWGREVALSNKQVYRHIKMNSTEVEDVRSQLNEILDNMSDKELAKVLKFIEDYMK